MSGGAAVARRAPRGQPQCALLPARPSVGGQARHTRIDHAAAAHQAQAQSAARQPAADAPRSRHSSPSVAPTARRSPASPASPGGRRDRRRRRPPPPAAAGAGGRLGCSFACASFGFGLSLARLGCRSHCRCQYEWQDQRQPPSRSSAVLSQPDTATVESSVDAQARLGLGIAAGSQDALIGLIEVRATGHSIG